MPKRASKHEDENQLAARIVAALEGSERAGIEATIERAIEAAVLSEAKNPHAVALGRLGGQKGGLARARKLSARRRKEIARKAARQRWKKTKS